MSKLSIVSTLKSTEEIEKIKKDAVDLINNSDHGRFIVIAPIDNRTVVYMGNLDYDKAIVEISYAKYLMIHEALKGMYKGD